MTESVTSRESIPRPRGVGPFSELGVTLSYEQDGVSSWYESVEIADRLNRPQQFRA